MKISSIGKILKHHRLRQAVLSVLCLVCFGSHAQVVLRIARIEKVPDQLVGGEILSSVYSKLGIQIEFVDVAAKRSLIESSEGRLDGEIQRVLDVQNEFPSLLPVPESINYIEPTVFAKSAKLTVSGWSSLQPYRIGIVRGVGSSERGVAGLQNVEAIATMDQMMLMLNADRIDVAMNDLFSGMLVLRRLGLQEEVHPLSPALQHIELYHFLNERHRALVPRVNAVVHQMKLSGELDSLRKQVVDRMLKAVQK